MASGLKRWCAAALAGVAVVAVLLLPVGSYGPRRVTEPRPERDRFEALQQEVMIELERIDRLAWLDGALAELDGARAEGRPLVVSLPPDVVDPATAEPLRARVEGEMADLGPPRADVGFFARRAAPSSDGIRRWNVSHNEYYVGVAGGRSFCLVSRIGGAYERSSFMRGSVPAVSSLSGVRAEPTNLGFCGFLVRYGRPGADVSVWLRAGGAPRGALRKASTPPRRWVSLSPRPPPRSIVSLAAASCLTGRVEACEEVFLGPLVDPRATTRDVALALSATVPELWGIETWARSDHFGVAESFLLSDLESEFGPVRFARFWSSDAPVVEAFREAFGVPAGEWMEGWARGYYPEARAGASWGPSLWGAPLLLFVAALLLALRKARRREVG